MTDTANSQYALAYAAVGLPVLPLRARQKTPLTAHGKDDATTDADQIAAWWNRWPRANIGIRPTAGLVVVDVDPRHGGTEHLATLLDGRDLPTTWTCRTGSGGIHIWLRHRGPIRGKLCQGVDLKGPSGYLVVPPSIHPDTGHAYRWLNRSPIAAAPEWLRPHLLPAPHRPMLTFGAPGCSSRTAAGLLRAVADAKEGCRNAVLFWAACTAAREGVLSMVRDDLTAAALANGLPPNEIERTIRSAEQKGIHA
ncbi:bifunctional DNA primase/polymerase [Nocardia thailandica]